MARTRMLFAALVVAALLTIGVIPAYAGTRRAMVRSINEARAPSTHGVHFSKRLSRGAAAWARHLFKAGVLAHSSSAGNDRKGEIIEWHTGSRPNVRAVVREWLASAGHRAVMLSGRYRVAGAGRAVGYLNGERSTIWVVRFAG